MLVLTYCHSSPSYFSSTSCPHSLISSSPWFFLQFGLNGLSLWSSFVLWLHTVCWLPVYITHLLLNILLSSVIASVVMTKWRTQIRRRMNDKDTITRGIHTDCLLNYETVKYFGGEEREGERYRDAIRNYQVLEYKVMSKSLWFLLLECNTHIRSQSP